MTTTPADITLTLEQVYGSPPPPEAVTLLWSAAHGGQDSCTSQMTRFSGAFADTATVRPVDLGESAWAILRISADDTSRVVCVHNLADHPVSFRLSQALPERGGTRIHFLRGALETGPEETGAEETDPTTTTCHLKARSYVWLGQRAEPDLPSESTSTPQQTR